MHLIAFSFEAASEGNLNPSSRMHYAYCVNALLYKKGKDVHTEHLHILFLCVVISNKFPRLLAEREIIANALNHSPDFSPNQWQRYKLYLKQTKKRASFLQNLLFRGFYKRTDLLELTISCLGAFNFLATNPHVRRDHVGFHRQHIYPI